MVGVKLALKLGPKRLFYLALNYYYLQLLNS